MGFGGLECHDFFFDGSLRDEPVDDDGPGLTDSVGAVDGLRLDGRVPPRVEQDDVVGLDEVEPDTARLERDEERWRVAGAELVDDGSAVGR